MLPQLAALLQASPKVASFQIIDSDAIDEENFFLKIRCELTLGTHSRSDCEPLPVTSAIPIRSSLTGRCGVGITLPIFLIFRAFPTITMTRKETLQHPG
jgi:hypothetical protein